MPVNMLQKISKTCDITPDDLEKYWDDAKNQAENKGLKEGDPNFYKFVVGVLKKIIGEKCVKKLGWNESSDEADFRYKFSIFEDWLNLRSRIGRVRRSRVSNVRRRQATKRAWQRGRSRYMKPIKRWHKSSSGRQFHRMLGRFNKNKRSQVNAGYDYEQLAPLVIQSLCEYMSDLLNSGLLESYNYPEVYDICELIGYIGQDCEIVKEILEEGDK